VSSKGTYEHDLWLGRKALSEGLITSSQLTEALLIQSKTGLRKTLDTVLVNKGWVTAEALEDLKSELVATQTQKHEVASHDPDAEKRLGEIICRVMCDKVLGVERHMTSYLGRLPRDPEPAALHLIPKAALREGLWMDFLETVRACQSVESPNLTAVLEVDRYQESFVVVTRHAKRAIYLDGLIKRVRRLKLSEALRILGELAKGLTDLHKANLVHRDLKPGRVVLSPDGGVRITLAGVTSRPPDAPAGVYGSGHWAAPEVCKGRLGDVRSDVYSLGVIGYELVTGVRPFEGESFGSLADQHRNTDVTPPHRVMSALPADVGDLLTWMLSKSPKDRPEAEQVVRTVTEVSSKVQRTGMTQKFQAFNPDE
jgi:serine/threonine protein kinase